MVSLVSLEHVRTMLRIGDVFDSPIDPHEDDSVLENVYIPAASMAVIRYLKGQASMVIPGLAESPQTDDGCPEDVQLAVIMLVGIIYREPDGDEAKNFAQGYLPAPVTALLYPLRDPTLA
jgi:hypothetical protein